MKEKLVLDYMKANGVKAYDDNDELLDLTVVGEYVLVAEQSGCLNYREQHWISVIDIIAWVYSLTLAK